MGTVSLPRKMNVVRFHQQWQGWPSTWGGSLGIQCSRDFITTLHSWLSYSQISPQSCSLITAARPVLWLKSCFLKEELPSLYCFRPQLTRWGLSKYQVTSFPQNAPVLLCVSSSVVSLQLMRIALVFCSINLLASTGFSLGLCFLSSSKKNNLLFS